MARTMSRSPKKRGVHRISVDVSPDFARQLHLALVQAAAKSRVAEITVAAWFRAKAQELITQFK